jgi:hypothetical protein
VTQKGATNLKHRGKSSGTMPHATSEKNKNRCLLLVVSASVTRNLKLYKTGRTNANDGGIDFVMKPLGRFFQVTETLDFKKYFLDIDKIQKYPVTFVIKSVEGVELLKKKNSRQREQNIFN